MEFFDEKEEVLDIQLTRHGKRKLMEGEFNPEYYSFHDEGILYDPNYADFDEPSNKSEDRIVDGTSYTKPQSIFSEAGKKELKEGVGKVDEIQSSDKIGTADLSGQEAPAIHLEMLEREIDSVTGSSGSYPTNVQDIPQINIGEVEYTISKDKGPPGDLRASPDPVDADIVRKTLPDGTTVEISGEDILIAVDEENTPFKNNNFDVEVFEAEDVTGSDERKLHKKRFVHKGNDEQLPDLFVPKDDRTQIDEVTSGSVSYFLDLKTDNEISRNILCRKLNEQSKDVFKEEIECAGVGPNRAVEAEDENPYESDSDKNESGEKCP